MLLLSDISSNKSPSVKGDILHRLAVYNIKYIYVSRPKG